MAGTDPVQLDLATLLEQFSQQTKFEQENVNDLQGLEQQYGGAADSEVAAVQNEAALAGQIKGAQNQILLDRSRRNQEAAAFFGVNPEASNSIIQSMAQDIAARHEQLTEEADQIRARQQKSFTDNPIDWIKEQFVLPADVAAHNTGVAIMESQIEYLKEVGDLADKQIARNNAIDANTSVAISRMEAERLAAAANARVANIRQEAAKFGIQLGTVRLATSQQAFSNVIALHQAKLSVDHLNLARASRDLQREQTELQRRNLELLIQKKEEDAKAKAEFQANLDRATSIGGMRRMSVDEYERAPQKVKLALFDLMSNPNIAEGRLGADTVDALENTTNLNLPLTPQLTEVKRALTDWSAAAATSNPTFAALKPEQKHLVVQKYLEAKIKDEQRNIPDQGGLYSAPSLYSVGQIPVVKNTILWKSTFEAQAAVDKRKPTSAQALYEAALGIVSKNGMSLDQAASELSTIYKAIAADNTTQRDYNRFALPGQGNYRTAIRAGDSFYASDARIVDMTNETAVKNALIRGIAAQKAMETGVMKPLPSFETGR